MKNITKTIIICTLIGLFSANFMTFAGNKDRSGQAGAQHLLIDPWARTNGWGGASVAEVRGLESIFSNVAGIAFMNKTEVAITRTQYLSGSGAGISINAFGIIQALKIVDKDTKTTKSLGTIGISVFNMGFGDIPVTTVDQPDGTSAIFSPKLNYIGLHYAYSFNQYIKGGVGIKIVNESISDLVSTGVAIDAGVQYVTGPYENFKIGVTLKNLGMPTSYSGDGIALRANPVNSDVELTLETRSAEAVLPACLVLGAAYDFLIFEPETNERLSKMNSAQKLDEGLTRIDAIHRITLAGSFIANAYSNDIFALGIEYGFKEFFMVRAGYSYESGQFDLATSTTFYSGPSAGVTFGIPFSKKADASVLYVDYGYRFTNRWKGNHYIGLKLSL
ncbi:MAG: hypothetical protein H6Q25_64 [Bacteroidetes bacterium]|nr:hypothetical protein [Bacteroidota bacterium]